MLMRVGVLRVAAGGEENLIEIGVVGVPELVAPGAVQCGDVAIFNAEPFSERAVGDFGLVEELAKFVVDLPADDGRVLAEMVGHRGDDAAGGVVKFGGEGIVMAAAAEARSGSVGVDGERFGEFVAEPDGGRGGRGAEDDLKVALARHLEALVQPIESEIAGAWLEIEPGEFRHVDDAKAEGRDVIEIAFPLVARPLFGVVIGADAHAAVQSVERLGSDRHGGRGGPFLPDSAEMEFQIPGQSATVHERGFEHPFPHGPANLG